MSKYTHRHPRDLNPNDSLNPMPESIERGVFLGWAIDSRCQTRRHRPQPIVEILEHPDRQFRTLPVVQIGEWGGTPHLVPRSARATEGQEPRSSWWQRGIGTVAAAVLVWGMEGLPARAVWEIVPVSSIAREPTREERREEALRLYQQAVEHYQHGRFSEALAIAQQVWTGVPQLGDRELESLTLNLLAEVYRNLGQYDRSLDLNQQALTVFRELGNRGGEASTLNNVGEVYRNLGQYDRALDYYQQALTIFRQVGNRPEEASALNNSGVVSLHLGRYEEALDYYQQALALYQEVGDLPGEGNTLNNLASLFHNVGEYAKASDYYQQALGIYREVGNLSGEGTTLNNLGVLSLDLGRYEEALDYDRQALAIHRQTGNRALEGTTLNNLAEAYRRLGKVEDALTYYQQALTIHREVGNRELEGTTLNNLGLVFYGLGNYEDALTYYQQALTIHRQLGERLKEGNALNNLGALSHQLGQYESALNYYQQALAISRTVGDLSGEGTTLSNLGATRLQLGQLPEAEHHLFEAIEIWESLRGGLTDQNKVSLFDTVSFTYRNLQYTLIAQNKIEAALEISERGRARAFVELLALRLGSQSQEAFVDPPPPTLAQIRQVAQAQNATLVEYSLVEDQLYIWVVQPTGEIGLRQVTVEEVLQELSLAELVDSSRSAMGVRGRGLGVQPRDEREIAPEEGLLARESTSRLQQLHQLLIEPIADLLPTDPEDLVIFVPQGELFLVPFPALLDPNGTYLVEKHTPLTAPAIQAIELMQQALANDLGTPGGAPEVLVVGNPTMPKVEFVSPETLYLSPLPGAQREADAIAQLLGTQALTGSSATESAVLERLPQARIVHLATHGLLDDFGYGIPGAIALAPSGSDDGLLTAGEILNLRLNVDLMVLSACDTGRGTLTGDGVVGLSRSLIAAGVSSLVVSLWKVDDAATSVLMQQFYRNWHESGSTARALRHAMLTTMQQYPEPRDWAAFIAIGDG